jgi:aspartokinase-like uncharacterized kinase
MSAPRRVVKLGGSLLGWPELAGEFRRWISLQPAAADVMIVGGGALVDALRALAREQSLSAERAHWLAVGAMSLTAALAANLLADARLVRAVDGLSSSSPGAVRILDVEQFLRENAEGENPLPCTWDVTSDSIAARVAVAIGAAELVLLKSALPGDRPTLDALAQAGYVDRYFPSAARGLDVRCVHLRNPEFSQIFVE